MNLAVLLSQQHLNTSITAIDVVDSKVAGLLKSAAEDKDTNVILMNITEAEAVKLLVCFPNPMNSAQIKSPQ